MKNSHAKAFTLVELIIVITIIAIIAAAIFVAIDPARRLHEARNARRQSDVATILDALIKYQVDNDGTHYSTIASMTAGEYLRIGTGTDNETCHDDDDAYTTAALLCAVGPTAGQTADDCVDLSGVPTNYLATVPRDPQATADLYTEYYISVASNGTLTIGACDEEGEDAGGGGTPPTIELIR
jgi:prepilin-type N-terminal cleavage/methylation domain-containing protein